jgi:hypothetical protein
MAPNPNQYIVPRMPYEFNSSWLKNAKTDSKDGNFINNKKVKPAAETRKIPNFTHVYL